MISNKLTPADIEKIIPEIVQDPKKFGWIKDFVIAKELPKECYAIIGAKGKGGSFRCCIRLIYQLLTNDRNGVIIRNKYLGHYRTVMEIRNRIIPLIERTTGKKISLWLELPSERVHNFNTYCIRSLRNSKAIHFLAYEDPNGFSNMSGIQEVFCEEFIRLSMTGDYQQYLELAEDNFIRMVDNFARFDDPNEVCNMYFSMNPNDPDNWFTRAVYPKAIDLSNEDTLSTLMANHSVLGSLESFCGRTWTIRHCSVYCNPHMTNQKIKMIERFTEDNTELSAFMLYGFPYDVRAKGYLYKYNLDLIVESPPYDVKLYNLRIGLDFGKIDKSVMCICADNYNDINDIFVLKIITIKNSSINNFDKIAFLLDKYLEWLKGTLWWSEYSQRVPLFFGTDNYYLTDICERTLRDYNLPLEFEYQLVPKAIKGMLINQRHLTLLSIMINGNLKCLDIGAMNLLIQEMKGTLYEDNKIIDKDGNDVKDAFFYANYNRFIWNTERRTDYNRPIPQKKHLNLK